MSRTLSMNHGSGDRLNVSLRCGGTLKARQIRLTVLWLRPHGRADGVEAAWRRLHSHGCVACYSPCLVEQNYLLSLDPRVIGQFVRRHLPRFG
jgi:hypothetical protein